MDWDCTPIRGSPSYLSAISEESEDEEGTPTPKRKEMGTPSPLHLAGTSARLKGLQELRALYRLSSKLAAAKEDDKRLRKEEDKITSLLEEDEAKEKKELKVFEKMEKITEKPTFQPDMSVVEQFLRDKMQLDTTQETVDSVSVEDSGSSEEEDSSEEDDEQDRTPIVNDEHEKHEKEDNPSFSQERSTEEQVKTSIEEASNSDSSEEEEVITVKENFVPEKPAPPPHLTATMNEDRHITMINRLKGELERLKISEYDHVTKIRQLEERLKDTHLEWSKKSSVWNITRSKLKKQIEGLEEKCKTLEEKLAKRPSPQFNPPKVHFSRQMGKPTNANAKSPVELEKPLPNPKPLKNNKREKLPLGHADVLNRRSPTPTPTTPPLQQNNQVKNYEKSAQTSFFEVENKCNERNTGEDKENKENGNFDGMIETQYPNGTRKYECPSKEFTRYIYKNGDIKEVRSDGSVHYYYAELGLRHYVYSNGLEMTTYNNGQIQRKNPDGTTEILFPNGCVKVCRADGKEEFIFPDNTVYETDEHGNTITLLPNGQKEIHNKSWKKRIFPDGTTKTVYSDGSMETTYANGRTRVKNSAGQLILDNVPEHNRND